MAATVPSSNARDPLGEMNMTPLIDVLLVLLVVFVMTIPIATHSLEVRLPAGETIREVRPDPVKNLLEIERDGHATWNGRQISDGELAELLSKVRAMRPEPEVQFRPNPNASYERAARVLDIVKRSRVTRFGFLDNERYRNFDRS